VAAADERGEVRDVGLALLVLLGEARAARHLQHLLDGRVLVGRALELGKVAEDGFVDALDLAVGDREPDQRRDERLAGRE
jgi:hypothetical protein